MLISRDLGGPDAFAMLLITLILAAPVKDRAAPLPRVKFVATTDGLTSTLLLSMEKVATRSRQA